MKSTSFGATPNSAASASGASGAGLRGTPGRTPYTAANRPGKNSSASFLVSGSSLFESTASRTPRAASASKSSEMPA